MIFVGVEATNTVTGYVLTDAGDMLPITEFDTAFHGVMELEYDAANGQLWALCDDACDGRTQAFEIGADGTFASVAIYERPAGIPNYANEGLAFAPVG